MNLKILTILTCFLIFSNIVLAIAPGVPHAFYGSVTVNGNPAPDGTVITAKINGVEVARTVTSDGKYGYPIGSFYVDDPNHDRSGEEIRFFVNGVDTGQTRYFCNGCVTKIDLAISQSQGGGGGGGGFGGGVPTTKKTSQENQTTQNQTAQKTETQFCEERWVCTDWSECKDGFQTRSCNDVNNCGTDLNKPLEIQPCSKEEKASQAKITGPTGFFLGLSVVEWIGGIIGGIIIAFCIIYIFRRKKIVSSS